MAAAGGGTPDGAGAAPPRPAFNATFAALPTTIFEQMSLLAAQHQSTNLGQGFPDDELEGPESMKAVAASSMYDHSNQYPPLMGLPELRQALAAHSLRHSGLQDDWRGGVLVTCGATEALAAAFLALLDAGDEVVLFAPLYDSYVPMARRAGAVPRVVQLRPPAWSIDADELAAAFTPRTKLLVLNTPHNPTGKVFSRQELELVAGWWLVVGGRQLELFFRLAEAAYCVAAGLCLQHGVLCLLDEVYQHLVLPGTAHLSLRQLPGLGDRCLRVGSAGKTFSFTGWKVGWVTGPVVLVAAVAKAHQFLIFTVPPSLQRAVAHGLDREQSFYCGLGAVLARKRELLGAQLVEIGFSVLPSQGTYFLVADFSGLLPEGSAEDDVAFCHRLTVEAGVTLIPVSAFYADRSAAPRTLVRFVFCKSDEKLNTACQKLRKYFQKEQ